MRTLLYIFILVSIVGCVEKEKPVKTFTARRVTEDNVYSFGPVNVKVNPDLNYFNISGNVTKELKGVSDGITKREFHIFARPGLNKIVLIETHTRRYPHTFQLPQDDLTKNMAVIQKGTKPVDGRTWEVYVRALAEFPAYVLSAVRQKGISIEQYRCGLEIGVAKAIDRFNRIYISYIEGSNNCSELPQNDSLLNDKQLQLIRRFADQYDKNITISDQSGG